MKGFATSVLWVVALSLAGYAGYNRFVVPAPCVSPITYHIGTIDPRFGVTNATFIKDIAEASKIWNDSMHTTLLAYDPAGTVTVNLVYDSRQQITQQENTLNSTIEQNKDVAASVKTQYDALQTSYQTAEQEYKTQLAVFNDKQDAYNSEVGYWNSKGGAPSDEFNALQTKKVALQNDRAALELVRARVNSLANQVNALISKYNLVVKHINSTVDTINNDGLAGTQFEEGVYITDASGKRINIYQFDDHTTFVRVLAHELGHALGLEHNNGKTSIMNPVNGGSNLTLSNEDLDAIKTQCAIKN